MNFQNPALLFAEVKIVWRLSTKSKLLLTDQAELGYYFLHAHRSSTWHLHGIKINSNEASISAARMDQCNA